MKPAQDKQLEEQIRNLRHEIEKLSALLAFRKMESRHPALRKLVDDITRAEASIKHKGSEAAQLGSDIVSHIRHCPYRHIAGRIVLTGIIGYAISLGLEWLIKERKGS